MEYKHSALDFRRTVDALFDRLAFDHPEHFTEAYIRSEKDMLYQEAEIGLDMLADNVDRAYNERPPVEVINLIKRLALLVDMYVWYVDFWEAPGNYPGVDFMVKHFPPGWDKNKIEEAAFALATDPSIKGTELFEPENDPEKMCKKWWISGIYEGLHMHFKINLQTQEIEYCCPLGDDGRNTSFKTVQELYGDALPKL